MEQWLDTLGTPGMALRTVPLLLLTHCGLCWRAGLGRTRMVDMLYSATGPGYLPSIDAMRRLTSSEARVMLLFEHRGLYMPRDYVIGTPFFQDRFFTTPAERETPGGIHRSLIDNGITHVLVGLSLEDPDRHAETLARSEAFAACLGELVQHGAVHSLWRSDAFELLEVNRSWNQ